ncbi:origin recognition complex subunit 3 isoform X1 [Panthera pardus]|uniref:Origin recognition complex subunit 3 n=5 Tax=Felidae TaxID=9681 RepID=A0ABI7XGP9_FELCA|nr:origin recognition complex subunit 3 isoform X1 [Felis catus]XP_007076980.1 origin recognition complex subunit 3 isoform X1 [Panthera tigris]XP_019298362.2 origin recognition complex subunit 3 isoform X1 [Panthera pardus]XP_026913074.1 origin recognition complex subunit 3 isoform X1 [Acinonyx jubatus]XP_030171809.1 origin recognition complex subunit 3 isoform X1 [Lynx canadensis]XP_046958377.1 origin recognition complex subunit 3 isoform X1 [Lynx rufus]XP_049509951.1 origin recognition com
MATSSVSKGCFVFKPNFKKRKISVPVEDYFNKGKNESEDSKLRFETYQLIWQQMKSETEQLQEELNKNLFNSLIEFLQQSYSGFHKNSRDWGCQIKLREIPTAALILGVNVTDHDLTFRSLTEALQNNVTPYVVSLQAKDCPDMKHFLQKLVSKLMNCCVDEESKEESIQVTQKKTFCSMDSLSSWYMSVTQKTDPKLPRKKRTSSSQWQSPPVVLILKDLESFTTKVLQDFIIISSQHLHEFPLILIFGIATSPIIIHRLLPHAVSSLLCIELFQSLSCKEHLTTVLDKLLLTTQFPFKLSEKVLQILTNIFLYHDFSIQNFIKGLQLSLLEHFYSQPLSVLCCNLSEAKRRINFLSENQCENIRRLPSFRRHVEKQASEKQVALLTNERFLKEEIQSLLENLHVYHTNYFLVLRCLHQFTSSLPKYPLGRQIRELYCTCLEKNIWDSEEYASALQLLRMLAKDELMTILQKCFKVFKSSSEKQLGSTAKRIEEFLAQFQSLDAEAKEEEDTSGLQSKGLQKTDLYHLQKSLLEMKELRRTSKKQTRFEALREKVVNFIDSLVREYLLPPETQPLHEVMYFSAAHTLRAHLNAAPRIALHTALNNPYYYLKNEALKSEEGCIPNVAPDICIAYKLHLECSRLINLVDWSEAFATVVTAAEKMDANSITSEERNEIIHARFIRAVSELELLGFIKPTKQKTDHVARLTWGGC